MPAEYTNFAAGNYGFKEKQYESLGRFEMPQLMTADLFG